MNKIITKIFIATFALGFFSLGLNFVLAGTLTTTEDPNQCSEIINYSSNGYSTNSTNGTTYTTASNNVLQWYINQTLAITLAAEGNTFDQGVCKANYIVGQNAEQTPWKVDLCNSAIEELITYQEKLFNAYITAKNPSLPTRGFLGHIQVWGLQNLMEKVSCHNNKDCKLGVNTTSDFLFCKVCSKIGDGWTELDNYDSDIQNRCQGDKVPTEDGLCCQPKPTECKEPTIKWSVGELNWDNKQIYTGEEVITVELDYSSNIVGELTYDGVVSTQGVQNVVGPTFNDKKITLSAKADLNSNIISIQIADGAVKLLNEYNCPGTSIKLEREVLCQDRDKRKDCSRYDASPVGPYQEPILPDPLIDYSFLDKFICVKNNITLDFCPCTRPPENNSCDRYFSGGFVDSKGCCDKCGINQKVNSTGTGCECSKTQTECAENGDKLNEKTCKCECDSTKRCCGILLNTVVPFIGDCIEMTSQNDVSSSNDSNTSTVNQLNAFPFLMMGLSKIVVTVILIFSFLIIIAAGLMMTTGVYSEQNYKKGMERVQKVVVGLILLGASGLILKLINPSFFGG